MTHPFVRLQKGCLPAQSQEHGLETRGSTITWGELDYTAVGPVSAPLCEEEHSKGPTKLPPAGYWYTCFWQNCLKQTQWGWHEGPAPCSSIGIYKRTPEWPGPPLAPHSLHRWEQVHNEHMWRVSKKESAEAVVNVILPVSSSSMASLVVGQWWSGSAYPWRDKQTFIS